MNISWCKVDVNVSVSVTIIRTWLWNRILNAMCIFMYLFVVYFSFAPVISASIHRYVNYFDIQVLMMVTETETLTSTLHHDIFTYLDYIFSCNLHIYIYIYIRKTFWIKQNECLFEDYKVCINWNLFMPKIISISKKHLFWGYSKW